jgi:ABC-type Fe3+/spermidine/putrescine transport system ATPase subunit
VMVRPEAIRLGGVDTALPGRVLQTSFLGKHVRVAVETAASEAPVIVALNDASALPAVGSAVSLSWSAEDAAVLESE